VGYLGHESCTETGSVFEVGSGWIAKLRRQQAYGLILPITSPITIEDVANNFDEVRPHGARPAALRKGIRLTGNVKLVQVPLPPLTRSSILTMVARPSRCARATRPAASLRT